MKYGIYELPCGEVTAAPSELAPAQYKKNLGTPLPEKCRGCAHLQRSSNGMKGNFCPGKQLGIVNLNSEEMKSLAVRKWQGEESTKELYRNAQRDREGF